MDEHWNDYVREIREIELGKYQKNHRRARKGALTQILWLKSDLRGIETLEAEDAVFVDEV